MLVFAWNTSTSQFNLEQLAYRNLRSKAALEPLPAHKFTKFPLIWVSWDKFHKIRQNVKFPQNMSDSYFTLGLSALQKLDSKAAMGPWAAFRSILSIVLLKPSSDLIRFHGIPKFHFDLLRKKRRIRALTWFDWQLVKWVLKLLWNLGKLTFHQNLLLLKFVGN